MLNILDLGFLSIAIFTFGTGYVIKEYEKHIPAFIVKSYKYGSFAYQGSGGNFIRLIEIPKAFYKHFYAFSSIFSALTLLYAVCVYFFSYSVDKYSFFILKLLLEQNESSVSVGAAILALLIIVVQCLRRYYETYYLQVFSNTGKINLSHYMVGFIHYFGVIIGAIGEAPLFCGDQNRAKVQWMDTRTKILSLPCILTFSWVWYEQYRTNVILANLRKDKKSGKVVTEEYKVPHGRLFNYVSSPHRFCEIIIYLLLLVLIPTKTYLFIFLWVVCNQTFGAILAHNWYKSTFQDYPDKRMAVFPGIL